jgi:hypothetical protein
MKKLNKLSALLAVVVFVSVVNASAKGISNKKFGFIYQENIKWIAFSAFPPQARLAVLVGNPKQNEPYVIKVSIAPLKGR